MTIMMISVVKKKGICNRDKQLHNINSEMALFYWQKLIIGYNFVSIQYPF